VLKYTNKNNTYITKPNNDVEIEIGDIKQKDFYPQAKFKRWDNEVNFSVRLKTETLQKPTKSKNIIATENIRFYGLSGGYEFEIMLKEKPITNVVEFTMQTKGLRFVYQGELTKKDVELGAVRPENVVGSYAVYYDGTPINIEGGKEYKAGKAFHIYRPKIMDAKGKWVWGILNIDTNKNILSVTIPQEFLDTATYPVSHAAGLTVGYETAGASFLGVTSNRWYAGYLTSGLITNNFDVSKLTASVFAGSVNFKGFIDVHNDQVILTNGISGATANSSAWSKHWQDLSYATHPIFSNGIPYDIGYISDGDVNFYYDSDGSYYVIYDTSNSYSSPTDPTGWEYAAGYHMSIYATYTVVTAAGHFMTTNRGYW